MKRTLKTFTFCDVQVKGRDVYDAYHKLVRSEEYIWGHSPKPNNWRKFAKKNCNRRFRRSKSVHQKEMHLYAKGWVGTYGGKVIWD